MRVSVSVCDMQFWWFPRRLAADFASEPEPQPSVKLRWWGVLSLWVKWIIQDKIRIPSLFGFADSPQFGVSVRLSAPSVHVKPVGNLSPFFVQLVWIFWCCVLIRSVYSLDNYCSWLRCNSKMLIHLKTLSRDMVVPLGDNSLSICVYVMINQNF